MPSALALDGTVSGACGVGRQKTIYVLLRGQQQEDLGPGGIAYTANQGCFVELFTTQVLEGENSTGGFGVLLGRFGKDEGRECEAIF